MSKSSDETNKDQQENVIVLLVGFFWYFHSCRLDVPSLLWKDQFE